MWLVKLGNKLKKFGNHYSRLLHSPWWRPSTHEPLTVCLLHFLGGMKVTLRKIINVGSGEVRVSRTCFPHVANTLDPCCGVSQPVYNLHCLRDVLAAITNSWCYISSFNTPPFWVFTPLIALLVAWWGKRAWRLRGTRPPGTAGWLAGSPRLATTLSGLSLVHVLIPLVYRYTLCLSVKRDVLRQ